MSQISNIKDLTALIETFLQHEIDNFKDGIIVNTAEEELNVLYEMSADIKLNDLITPEQMLVWINERVINAPDNDDSLRILEEYADAVHAFVKTNEVSVETILPQELYYKIVKALMGFKTVRRELINWLVSSSIYHILVADILYQMLKDIFLSLNQAVRKIPGLSLVIRAYQGMLGKTMSYVLSMSSNELETTIDELVTDYIQNNVQKYGPRSKYFHQAVDEFLLEELGSEIWESTANNTIARLSELIEAGDLKAFAPIILEHARYIRKTEFFAEIIRQLIDYGFTNLGDKTIREIFDVLGISRDLLIKKMALSGSDYLGKRLRNRLEALTISKRFLNFYNNKNTD